MLEPALLGWVVKMASRSALAVPGTYSKRVVRLSETTMSVIGRPPVLVYLRVKVTRSPTRAPILSGHLIMRRGPSAGSGASGGGQEPSRVLVLWRLAVTRRLS